MDPFSHLISDDEVLTFSKTLADVGPMVMNKWVLPRGDLWGHLREDLT